MKAEGEVDLPILDADATIESAFEAMRGRGRSGVVVERDGARVLITADELIVHMREQGDVHLLDIKPRRHGVEAPDAGAFAIVRAVRAEAKQHLGAHGTDYLIGVAEDGSARVLTAHEHFAFELSQPLTLCRCQVNATHVYRPQQLKVPGRCNRDGAQVDCS